MSKPSPLSLAGAFILVTFIWGTTWSVIRVALDAGVTPFAGVSLRFAVAAAVLFLLAPFLGVSFRHDRRIRMLWLVNAALNFCVSYGLVHWGEQWVPSGLASVLFATYPLLLALMAHFVLRDEPLTLAGLTGILVGFAGVAVIFSEDLDGLGGKGALFAAALMLLAPLSSAVSSVVIKRWGRDVHPFSLSAVPMGITAGVMGGISLASEPVRAIPVNLQSVSSVLYLGVFGSAVTFTLYFWMLSHMPATRLSLITYVIPVVATALGVFLMDEPFTGRTLSGSALVLGGVALALQAGRRRVACGFQNPPD
jgi:drug/metabolite transporter (DMT)-like permease